MLFRLRPAEGIDFEDVLHGPAAELGCGGDVVGRVDKKCLYAALDLCRGELTGRLMQRDEEGSFIGPVEQMKRDLAGPFIPKGGFQSPGDSRYCRGVRRESRGLRRGRLQQLSHL
jgi:hypothetical protein